MAKVIDFNAALTAKELETYLGGDEYDPLRKDKVLAGLNSSVESFVAWLFPAAIITPKAARVGNIHGSPGTSLVIETRGGKQGVWSDFADPDQKGGNLIDLYMAARDVPFKTALDELAEWVGHGTRPEVSYQREQAAKKLKRFDRDLGPQKGEWHYTDPDGTIIATVYRFEPEGGGKEFLPWDAIRGRYGNPDVRPLYNLPQVLRSPSVVLCEGEKAADALIAQGIVATAVMGGSNSPLERTDLTPLQGKELTIWPDADEPGRKFAAGFAVAVQDIATSVRIIEPPVDAPKGWDAADCEDPLAMLGMAKKPTAEQLSPLPLEWAGQVTPILDGFWLIDDWLPTSGIAAIYGHPGSGKSFFAFSMAAHVASGKPWNGQHVERGLVIYVIAEGQTGARNRMFAMRENGDIAPDAPLAFVPTPVDMQSPTGDTNALIQTVKAAAEIAGMKPAMVVLDTLSKTFGAGKENTDDMVAYVNNCQRVASAFDCLTVVVHHRPKDTESKDLRGHSSLRGNIDTAILIEKGDIKTATTIKQKDGEDNIQVRFKLNRVVIGNDRRGKEISTCLLEFTDEAPVDQLFDGLNKTEEAALHTLCELIEEQAMDPETGEVLDCPGLICSEAWKEAMRTTRTISPDNAETAGRQFRRIRKSLDNKGKLEFDGNMVGIARTQADGQADKNKGMAR
jgi:KaiC/GvpD/RAD55 family RecA-like ATPase